MMEKAVFGGGCFWCTEAVFKMMRGVATVLPGYARAAGSEEPGGEKPPTYQSVSTGTTDYAEVAYLEYDPAQVKYNDLLTVFFASHDPTSLNRQGNDVGPQYRSAIFYTTPEQKAYAEAYVKGIEGAVTEVSPLGAFFPAENYHHDYYETHKDAPYCQIIINPKLEKVQKRFAELLKTYEQ
jgi:peptide-methionine (S)-S-oxide reductase